MWAWIYVKIKILRAVTLLLLSDITFLDYQIYLLCGNYFEDIVFSRKIAILDCLNRIHSGDKIPRFQLFYSVSI